jgi:UDP-glucuronate decarboxylase
VLDLALRIIILTASRSKIERWPLPVDDPTRRRPDISRAIELLGWRLNVTFEAGLAATVACVESELTRISRQTLKVQREVA